MNEAFLLVAGALLSAALSWGYRSWERIEKEGRRKAKAVLKKHGLFPHLYLASMGIEDQELRHALVEFDHTGYIILNSEGSVAGRVLPRVAVEKKSHLKLVSSRDCEGM